MAAPDKTTFGIVFVVATVGFVFFSLKLSHYTTLGIFLLQVQLWLNPSLAGVNFFIARNCEVLFYAESWDVKLNRKLEKHKSPLLRGGSST